MPAALMHLPSFWKRPIRHTVILSGRTSVRESVSSEMSSRSKRPRSRQSDDGATENKRKQAKKSSSRPLKRTRAPASVIFSAHDRSSVIQFSQDRTSMTGTKGYRMVRASHGVHEGRWYFEFILPRGQSPDCHFRLGWSNERGDSQGPVGMDHNSYAYRDVGGSKVHCSVRHSYGESYGPGDVIGCMISLPTGGLVEDDSSGHAHPDDRPVERPQEAWLYRATAFGVASQTTIDPPEFPLWSALGVEHLLPEDQPAAGPDATPAGTRDQPPANEDQARRAAELPSEGDRETEADTEQTNETAQHAEASPTPPPAPAPAESAESATGAGETEPTTKDTVDTESASAAPSSPQKKSQKPKKPESWIRFFLNGVDQGMAFAHLTPDRMYFPAASAYRGGTVHLNAGPTFRFPPQRFRPKPLSDAIKSTGIKKGR